MSFIVSVQGLPFLACLAMLAILCYVGIHVLKREIIFIDIALAQIAAVGAIAAHVVFHFHGHSIYAQAMALGSTFIAAVFFAVVRRKIVQVPLEAVIGVSYAVSAAAALFLVGVAPGGHVHIQEMLAGSILWATWSEVGWSAGIFAVVGLCFYVFRRPFRVISENYNEAVARGLNTLGWDFLFYALVGVVITMAVRVGGVVVVFTFLIIPATLSAVFASGWPGRLVAAWVAGTVSSALGLLFAARYDFSVGPSIAMFLGAGLIVIALLRAVRVSRLAAGGVWAIVSIVLGAWFATGANVVGGNPAPPGSIGGVPEAGNITHTHSGGSELSDAPGTAGQAPEGDIDAESLATIVDIGKLQDLYSAATDAEERSDVTCRLLEVDVQAGVHMALSFLEDDPPLLFRATVVDKLEEVTGESVPYAVDQPFASPANQQALAGIRASAGVDQNDNQ
jgi:zinc/manganese transport system permease protein